MNSIYFNFDFFTGEPEKQRRIAEIKFLLKQMLHLTNVQPNREQLHFNAMLFQLLAILYDNFKKEQIVSEMKKHGKNLTRLEPVLEYTNQHYNEPISLSEIASVISLQTEYFCRFFKRNMGITYLQYLNEIRLSHIYNDLLTTDIPLSHLLETHGFLNYKLFRKMFYEKFGSTPGTMRKNRAIKSGLN
nr:AraC family transcriptional regulator [uncultured Lachnoclostridium sp.]